MIINFQYSKLPDYHRVTSVNDVNRLIMILSVVNVEVNRFFKILSVKNSTAFSGGTSIFLKYAYTTFFL